MDAAIVLYANGVDVIGLGHKIRELSAISRSAGAWVVAVRVRTAIAASDRGAGRSAL